LAVEGYRCPRCHRRIPQESDPRATDRRRPKTLAGRLEELGVKPADIEFLAVSHTHPDHVGNVSLYPTSMLLVQKVE